MLTTVKAQSLLPLRETLIGSLLLQEPIKFKDPGASSRLGVFSLYSFIFCEEA